jgi:hypothetical protein
MMKTEDQIRSELQKHQTLLDYHLGNWERAQEVGSPMSAERSLHDAAAHAAIVSVLRMRLMTGDYR